MWIEKESPSRLEKRFEFDGYQKISFFMERIEKLCKEEKIFPNISFGKNFVSISIFLDSDNMINRVNEFSSLVDKFYLED